MFAITQQNPLITPVINKPNMNYKHYRRSLDNYRIFN